MREVMSELFNGASRFRVFQMPELTRPEDQTPASRCAFYSRGHQAPALKVNQLLFNAALQHLRFTPLRRFFKKNLKLLLPAQELSVFTKKNIRIRVYFSEIQRRWSTLQAESAREMIDGLSCHNDTAELVVETVPSARKAA